MQLICEIDRLAARIELAYRRHHPLETTLGDGADVWIEAARSLMELHRLDPSLPADPELFVATLTRRGRKADPARDLNRVDALARYRRRVRRIVRHLRSEVLTELRWVEARLTLGRPLDGILAEGSPHLSPLGRYIAARRHGRADLACLLQSAARRQHLACPLYQQACRGLLPRGGYPVDGLLLEAVCPELGRFQPGAPGWN